MVTSFAEAIEALYRAPLEVFVAERKRLATELKANADKPGAARLVKLARPPISTWVVNQLWWQERDVFDELFASAARLRAGDLRATPSHREAIAALRARAIAILTLAGHAANDATLRRVTTNLSALAAAGGFEPDFAGALAMDREAPGFGAAGLGLPAGLPATEPEQRGPGRVETNPGTTTPSALASVPRPEPANQNQLAEAEPPREQPLEIEPQSAKEAEPRAQPSGRERKSGIEPQSAVAAERQRVAEETERQRVAEETERQRVAEETERQRAAEAARLQAEAERLRQEARRRAERQQVRDELRLLDGEREARLRETQRLRQALALAEQALEQVDSKVATLDARLAELDRVTPSSV
jgi:hypothetical protein